MLAQAPVVQPQDQPQPGVEPAGGQGGPDVGLVVVVHEGQRGGPFDTGVREYVLGRLGGVQFAVGAARIAVARPVDRRVDHVQQRRRGRAGPPDHRLAHPAPGGRDDEGDLFAVDAAQFGGQPVGQPVVAAHHHVRVPVAVRNLVRNAPV